MMFSKDDFTIKVRGAFILWFIIVVHIIFIFNLCTMVSSMKNKQYSKAEIEAVVEDKLKESNTFGDITEIYSSCNHSWEVIDKSNNGVHVTVACNECGTIQVIDITKSALYINVGK